MTNKYILIFLLLTCQELSAQSSVGFEQYWCSGQVIADAAVAKVWYDAPGLCYVEARYNYDADNTAAISFGKTFSGHSGSVVQWTCTPTLGVMAGSTQGAAVGMNVSFAAGRFHAASMVQTALLYSRTIRGLPYSWTEAGVQLCPAIAVGATLQQQPGSGNCWHPGASLAITIGSWTLPVYLFDPFSKQTSLIAGITREWAIRNKIRNPKSSISNGKN